jgi:hypothetical protein
MYLSLLQSERKEVGDYARQAVASFVTWFTVFVTINLGLLSALYPYLFSGSEEYILFIRLACMFFIFLNILGVIVSYLLYVSINKSKNYLIKINRLLSQKILELKELELSMPYAVYAGTAILAMLTTSGLVFSWAIIALYIVS